MAIFFHLAGLLVLIHSPPVVGSFYLPSGSLEHELTCIMYEMCGTHLYNVCVDRETMGHHIPLVSLKHTYT